MEKVINRILDEQKKDKDTYPNESFVKNLLKFDRDKLFKGHHGNVHFSSYAKNEKYITFVNKYYDALLINEYRINEDRTILTVMTEFKVPKYFKKFMDLITDNDTYELACKDHKQIKHNEITYGYDGYYFHLRYTYHYDDFLPIGHYENLKVAQELRNTVRRLRSIVRENVDDDTFCENIRYIKENKVYLSDELFV
jgi:hypothetical protein